MSKLLGNVWSRYRAFPMWARLPIGLVAGFFALGIVLAPFTDPDEGQRVASQGPTTTSRSGTTTSPSATTVLTPPTALPAALPTTGDDTTVASVIDGDTIEVASPRGTRVRFIGIDTPESTASVDCFGTEATARTRELLPVGTEVRLTYDVERLDRFGRTLAYVYRLSDGLFVNLELARAGYAQQLTIPPNLAHAGEFARAAADAHISNRGLWAACLTKTVGPATTAVTADASGVGSSTPPAALAAPALAPAAVVPSMTATTAPAATAAPTVPPWTSRTTTTAAPRAGGCHASYTGACVPIASDVDCAGGTGDGPAYVYEKNFEVVGPDEYGLDSDNDLIACESR